jgi:hypothetical protein
MRQNGKYMTYNNRRVMAARKAKVKCIPINEVDPNSVHADSTTGRTWEQKFKTRMNDKLNPTPVPYGGLPTLPNIRS